MRMTIALALVATQIGSASAQIPVENVMPEPGRFTQSQAAVMCSQLLEHYTKALAIMSAHMPGQFTTAAVGQAAEARALAFAGGCPVKPFVDAYMAQTK
jgi:hypothetical protein